MSIKNNETKLLFNDFEDEGSKKSGGEIDFCVKYKDLGLDNNEQYYSYFYKKHNGEKNFVFDESYVPEIRENAFGAYDVEYSCNKNCVGLRFFVANQKIISCDAKNMSPGKNKNVTWYEVKQDEEGKKYIAKYNGYEKKWEKTNISFAYSNDHFSLEKKWKMGPQEKYGKDKFLMHFYNLYDMRIRSDKTKISSMISKDISLQIDINNLSDDIKIYGCMQLKPNDKFYFDWNKKSLRTKFEQNGGTINIRNGYVEDVFAMRFYITKQDINFKIGDDVTENTFSESVSVFEVRRDENSHIVLWHLKDKEKDEWEAVDGEVSYCSLHRFVKNVYTEQITYHCTTQLANDISKSYTVKVKVKHSRCGKEIISENTAEIESDDKLKSTNNANNIKDNEAHKQHKTNTDKSNSKTKFNHIGKTIFFGLISVGVGLFWGWLYALIPIAVLIVVALLDQKLKFLPGPKKILSCVMPCLSCLKEVEEEKNPEGDKSKIKDIEI
ncbi:MAG: hypothetical protein IJU86_04420 [Firmicutes bacterium]|nr:hypothetical protein [Bacillota bacterium]